jgi:1,3-beta-glucanosyltransferase GAS5
MSSLLPSLSEYGCNTNARKFEEVAALYNKEMTSVYSGGLVYEYSEEGSKYGLVTIGSDGTVTEGADFAALKIALAGTPAPTGDGGYNSTGGASGCPAHSSNWNVTGDALPAIPSAAAAMMKNGAGKGFGLTGTGSQNSGGTSTGTAAPGSGSVTATSTSKKSSAPGRQPPFDKTPILVAGLALAFSVMGACLL